MSRPIQAIIHPNAIQSNLKVIREKAQDARIWAVVKANAYGHGIERVYQALLGADGFALLEIDEAQKLRDLGWRGPILLLEGCFEPRDLEWCSRLRLWHTIHCDEQIEWLSRHKTQEPHRIFLKLNSGMNRLGFAANRFRSVWARLEAMPQVDEISIMSHFSDADNPNGIEQQMQIYLSTCQDLIAERSLSNSAALLRHNRAEVRTDWVRPGLALYGSSPDFPEHSASDWGLKPAMSLRAQIIAVQSLRPGETIGYGSTYRAEKPMRIGVVACGYADGYPRNAPSGTPVLVNNMKSQIVGRVSMDMLAVDLTELPTAGIASEVVLWGCSSDGTVLSIDEPAFAAGTIAYELMCALAARVKISVS
jgi:alanine racemase